MKVIYDFDHYEPWAGAIDTYETIERANELETLENFLDEIFEGQATATQINDLLWFEGDYVLSALGLAEEEGPDLQTEYDCTLDDMGIDIREEEDIDAAINECGIEFLNDAVSPDFLKYTILGADFTRDLDKVHFYNIKWSAED